MHGGRRDGAGRPAGSPTSRAVDWLDVSAMSPLETLMAIMRDSRTPAGLRVWCAVQAAPYVHRRLGPETAGGRLIAVALDDKRG